MGFLKVSADDLKAVEVPSEDWQPLKVKEVETKLSSKGDGSKVHHVTFQVISGADAGKTTKDFFSEKLIGMIGPLLEALGVTKDANGSFILEDTSALVGLKCEGRIKHGMFDGRMTAKPEAYRPFGS